MVVALEFVWSSMRIFDYLFCRREFWSHTSPRDLARVRSSKAAYSETRNERGKRIVRRTRLLAMHIRCLFFLPRRPTRQKHNKVDLGLARRPRTPTNLVGRGAGQQGVELKGRRIQGIVDLFFDQLCTHYLTRPLSSDIHRMGGRILVVNIFQIRSASFPRD